MEGAVHLQRCDGLRWGDYYSAAGGKCCNHGGRLEGVDRASYRGYRGDGQRLHPGYRVHDGWDGHRRQHLRPRASEQRLHDRGRRFFDRRAVQACVQESL